MHIIHVLDLSYINIIVLNLGVDSFLMIPLFFQLNYWAKPSLTYKQFKIWFNGIVTWKLLLHIYPIFLFCYLTNIITHCSTILHVLEAEYCQKCGKACLHVLLLIFTSTLLIQAYLKHMEFSHECKQCSFCTYFCLHPCCWQLLLTHISRCKGKHAYMFALLKAFFGKKFCYLEVLLRVLKEGTNKKDVLVMGGCRPTL